jgi:shikimate dehydrogenase
VIGGATRLVGLLGNPVAGSLSPRMQNAAFAARGLDWVYLPLLVERGRLGEAVAGLVGLGFAGANVTAPYKTDVVAFCDEVDAESVNLLVVQDGRVVGSSTDAEALRGLETRTAAVLGSGGASRAWVVALEAVGAQVRVFARRGDWPPDVERCDLVVNATPVKHELLFQPRPEQAVIDLPYNADGSPTALVEAAYAAGCRAVVEGLDVLARQGAASFERWTGVPAPLGVMLAAIRAERGG